MGKRTPLVLLVLCAALLFLWLRMHEETLEGGPALAEYPLCPGLEPDHVRAVRIDHLQRSFQLKVERDAAGRWFMTDPVEYPAQTPLVRTLLQMLESARAEPAPEAVLAQVGLEPPAVVLECVVVGGDLADGGEHTLRIELGAPDVDPSRVYARVPGHPAAAGTDVFRTNRALVNTLERVPDDYRDRRATPFPPEEVISLRRRGLVYLDDELKTQAMDFDALLGPDGWKRVTQATVSLDPNAMGLLARGATELTIVRFVDDSPQDFAMYGLDPPAFTLEIETLSKTPVVLAFGHPKLAEDRPIEELTWFCQRQGYAHVWEVEARDVALLARPSDLFFDQLLVRVVRGDVVRLELASGGATRVLEREKKGWTAREERAGAADAVAPHPGNSGAIEEALALLERAQLAEHFEGEEFVPADPPERFTLVLKNGARLGGALGRPTRDPKSGAQGRQFLRDGDDVVALVGDDVAELCARPFDVFRSRKVHQLQESLVRSIDLEHAGHTFTFVNTGENLWNPKGQAIRAPPDFLGSLDGLLNLGAERWLDTPPDGEAVLTVRIVLFEGAPLELAFLRLADGTVACRTGAGQGALVDPALVERLLKLF